MHKYICVYRYGNIFCCELCLACKGYFTNHIQKPIEPKKEACCGDSCPNCVWVNYFDEVKKYNSKIDKTLTETMLYYKQKEDKKIKNRLQSNKNNNPLSFFISNIDDINKKK